jgi:hypothetical protein
VLTGERWILDNLLAQAAWNLTDLWPFPRLDGVGIAVNTEIMQTRSAAWTMRQIEQAAWAAPDGSAEKAYFTKLADTNWKWLVEQLPAWTAEQGEAHGWLPTWDKIRDLTPWQQDYFASTAISAASRGNADALTYLNWAKNFLIGRFEAAEEGFNIRDGAAFVLHVRPVDGAAPFRPGPRSVPRRLRLACPTAMAGRRARATWAASRWPRSPASTSSPATSAPTTPTRG